MRTKLKPDRSRPIIGLSLAALFSAVFATLELAALGETGIASLLSPISGVVFVVALCLGPRGVIASVIGLSLGYLQSSYLGWPVQYQSPVSPMSAAMVISGQALQGQLQSLLYRRLQRRSGTRFNPLIGLLLVAPLSCVVSASITTWVLHFEQGLPGITPLRFWVVTYVGSMLGVTVIYPLAWLLERRLRYTGGRYRSLRLIAGVSVVTVGTWALASLLVYNSIQLERSGVREHFAVAARYIADEAEDIDLMAIGLRALAAPASIDAAAFQDVATTMLARDASLDAMALVTAVPDARGGWVVDAAVPAASAARMVGLTLSGDTALGLRAHADSDEPRVQIASGNNALQTTTGHNDPYLIWLLPMPRRAQWPPQYVLVLQRPESLMRQAIEDASGLPNGTWVQLLDVSSSSSRRLLYTGDARGDRIAETRERAAFAAGEIYWQQRIALAGHYLELRLGIPTVTAYSFSLQWWLVQVMVQLLGAALAAAIVLAVDRRETLRDMDRQVAVLSRRYLHLERSTMHPSSAAIAAPRPAAASTQHDAALLRAFERGEFRQFYEPVVNLADGRIVGFESLLRWPEAVFDINIPEIVTWAERTQHVHALTLGALSQAVKLVETWAGLRGDLATPWISINVSPDDVCDMEFIDRLQQMFQHHPLARRRIKLEITEGVLVRDFRGVAQRLRGMRDQGVGIALDDFGTGYSSLSYLHQLPVDSIKIDRSFVCNLDRDPRVREIVQTTVELAHRLKLDVVAEGVEHASTARYLHDIGCGSAQGWLYSKAQPATTISDWVRSDRHFPWSMAEAGA